VNGAETGTRPTTGGHGDQPTDEPPDGPGGGPARGASAGGALGGADPSAGERCAVRAARWAGLYLAFAVLALVAYAPALHGEFLSDDVGYVLSNPYIQDLSLENVWVILDPFGAAAAYTANYAPVHLLLHAVEWHWFGVDTFGYHVVNVLLHAAASLLLVPLFAGAGVPRAWALAGALLFLLHPANAEVVAWIFQLKTILCLLLGTAAVLLLPRHPLLATLCFALALGSKTSAVFALPAAAWFALLRQRQAHAAPARWAWLAAWAGLLALHAGPQLLAFERLGETAISTPEDVSTRIRTMAAIGARYLVMAATGTGLSAFHQPAPARSWLDPWWLAALLLAVPLVWRAGVALWRLRPEGGFWIWAAATYAPVSQLFPFLYPMADRYLYTVLPGLLGVALLAGGEAARSWSTGRPASLRRQAGQGGLAAVAVLALVFAVQSHARATVFRSNAALMLDSARAYPEGISGRLLAARRAAQRGDAAAAADALRGAAARGFDRFMDVPRDPGLRSVAGDPRVEAVVREMAGRWIELARARGYSTALELRVWAQAHGVRGEWEQAVALLERALAAGGALAPALRAELADARRHLRLQRLDGGAGARVRGPATRDAGPPAGQVEPPEGEAHAPDAQRGDHGARER